MVQNVYLQSRILKCFVNLLAMLIKPENKRSNQTKVIKFGQIIGAMNIQVSGMSVQVLKKPVQAKDNLYYILPLEEEYIFRSIQLT